MKYWFYAVMSEKAGWYNVAIKSTSLESASSSLKIKYPHAEILEIEQGSIV